MREWQKKSISVIAPPEDINLLLRKNEKYYIVVRLLAVHFLIGAIFAITNCATSPIKKCGADEYNRGRQFCFDNVVYDQCGSVSYDPQTQACSGGSVSPKCGSDLYDPSTQYCKSGTTLTDYSAFTDNRDGKTYKVVTIGNQTWMSENLNCKVGENSACYENKDFNCEKYGRLYDWSLAMDGDSKRIAGHI